MNEIFKNKLCKDTKNKNTIDIGVTPMIIVFV